MMKKTQALSLAEVKEIVKGKETNINIESYIKKFQKIDIEKTKKINSEIKALDNLKIKEKDISKIIDLVPEDAADLNKIFSDVNLEEDEIKKILEIVKKHK